MLEWSCTIMWQLEYHSFLLEMLLQWRHLLPTNRSCPCYLRDLIFHENVIICQNPNKLFFQFNKQFVQETLSLCIILYVYPVYWIYTLLEKCRQFYACSQARVHLKIIWKIIEIWETRSESEEESRIFGLDENLTFLKAHNMNLYLCLISS